jgi:tyrosinase
MATKKKVTIAKTGKAKTKAAKSVKKATGPIYAAAKVYKSSKTIPAKQLPATFSRADLEFIDVDHSGASFEARVFINNPNANENTPTDEASGYAGSFNIFGHGGCFGDVGHCEVRERRDEFDFRPAHALVPAKKVVIATEAISRAAQLKSDITITVVPVVKSWTDKSDRDDVLKFDHINLVTYD